MTQTPTKIAKEDEKLIRLEKKFNKKIQKDPELKKQIDSMNKSFRNFSQNYKDQIDSILSDEQIRKISEESQKVFILPRKKTKKIELNETNFGLEVLDSGIFKYKGKILSITTNSNPGKLFKQLIENSDHFVPDTFCFENFNTPSSNDTRDIIKNIKNKLKKDNLTIDCKRVGDPSGYVLIGILDNQPQINHNLTTYIN